MAKKVTTDQKTLDLITEVKRQKAEISAAESPRFKTNMSFTYGRMNDSINLNVESNIMVLVGIVGYLRNLEKEYEGAAIELGLALVDIPSFTWQGFSVGDWFDDIKLRINKIQITSKKKKLETLETRLNAIISPELRAQMELDAIASELQ